MATFPGWEQQVLQQLGITNPTVVAKDAKFLDAWQRAEGGTARNNPLNTTQSYPGSTNYNSVGVKNYPSSTAGAAATSTTLQNGYYPGVVAALRAGTPDALFSSGGYKEASKEIGTWGTNYAAIEAQYNEITGTNYNIETVTGGAASTPGQVVGAVTGSIHSIEDALKFVFSYRFLEIVGGGLLLLLGLYLLARQLGVSVPTPPLASAAASVVP